MAELDMVGETITEITSKESWDGGCPATPGVMLGHDVIEFTCLSGRRMLMYHSQDCCESVSVEDVTGDIADIIGSPILKAEETSNNEESEGDSTTWTFYHFSTIKGTVTLRWLGQSNGYYSESVDFVELKN